MLKLNLPKKVYFKRGSINVALRELTEVYHLKRALLVSDANLYAAGAVTPVKLWLNRHGMQTAEFFSIHGTPSFADIRKGLPKTLEFQPDVLVGIGGGHAMSAAKALWALYENPELELADAVKNPALLSTGRKAQLFLAATSFGSGAQNSPYAVMQNDEGQLCCLADLCLLPIISSTDADFTASLTPEQVRTAASDALTQTLHALTAKDCCEYTAGLLKEAAKLILQNLEPAAAGCPAAREKLHNAGSIAGSAYGNVTLPADPALWLTMPPPEVLGAAPHVADLARELGYAQTEELLAACAAVCG